MRTRNSQVDTNREFLGDEMYSDRPVVIRSGGEDSKTARSGGLQDKQYRLDDSGFGTHSLRRTKVAQLYRETGNLRAVQLLLGHAKIETTVRYLGVEVDDALRLAEQIELQPGRQRAIKGRFRAKAVAGQCSAVAYEWFVRASDCRSLAEMTGILGAEQGQFGRATLFDIREPVADHAHPHIHLLFKVSGSDRGLNVAGEDVILADDNCLLVNPWQRHADVPELCVDPTVMLALYVDAGYLADRYDLRPTFISTTCTLSAAGLQRVGVVSSMLALGHDADDRQLEETVLALVDEALDRGGAEDESSAVFDYRIRRAMAKLKENPRLHPDFAEIASNVGLSRSRFFEQFKKSLGIAPAMYVDGLLLEVAIEMLVHSDRPIEEISAALGFSAQSSFTRFVKDRVGFPPNTLRHAAAVHH